MEDSRLDEREEIDTRNGKCVAHMGIGSEVSSPCT